MGCPRAWVERCRPALEDTLDSSEKREEKDLERAVPNPETFDVLLRDVTMSDLSIFFDKQPDWEANQMVAFTAKDPTDRDVFMTHWTEKVEKTLKQKLSLFTSSKCELMPTVTNKKGDIQDAETTE